MTASNNVSLYDIPGSRVSKRPLVLHFSLRFKSFDGNSLSVFFLYVTCVRVCVRARLYVHRTKDLLFLWQRIRVSSCCISHASTIPCPGVRIPVHVHFHVHVHVHVRVLSCPCVNPFILDCLFSSCSSVMLASNRLIMSFTYVHAACVFDLVPMLYFA